MNEHLEHLQFYTSQLQHSRIAQRAMCREILADLLVHARRMSARFNEEEMLVLAAVYERFPWPQFWAIDATEADPSSPIEKIDGAFSQLLAAHFDHLTCVASDYAFTVPEEPSNFAPQLSDKVRCLNPYEAVALHATLEAARVIPAAVISYENWWTPDMMLRLLDYPDRDWPYDWPPRL